MILLDYRIFLLTLVISTVTCDSGRVKVGYQLLDNIINKLTKDVYEDLNNLFVNNHPDVHLNLSPIKFIPLSIDLSKLKFEELVYQPNILKITHISDSIDVNLCKISLSN